jgi:hydroxymethylpyrimidine/phosphomethylpyrimidine kinase
VSDSKHSSIPRAMTIAGSDSGGGFKSGMTGKMSDVLYDGVSFTIFTDDQIPTTNTHGTGCTLSSAIAAGLSRARPIPNAVADAKAYLTDTLRHSFPLVRGHGPVNHLFGWWTSGGANGKGGATHSVTRESA